MQQHLSAEQINRYRARTLAAREFIDLDEHLRLCTDCRAQIYNPEAIHTAFQALRARLQSTPDESEHLSYEEKRAFIKEESDALGQELVENHIEVCPQCADELESFRQFAAMMDADRGGEPTPSASFWEKALAVMGLSAGQPRLIWAGLAAAILVLTVMTPVVFIYTSRNASKPEIAQQNEPPPQGEPPQPVEPPKTNNPVPQPANPPSGAIVATITLSPAFARGGNAGKSFSVSERTRRVRFEVNVTDLPYKSYQATLHSAAGKTWSLGTSKSVKGSKVVFTLTPVGQLLSGEYMLRLSGVTDDGNVEPAGNCPFRILNR
jgi:hypothetical protein